MTRPCGDRTRGNGFELEESTFRLGLRKKLLPVKVVRLWYRLHGKAVFVPSLEVFRTRLDMAWSSFV